MQIIVDRHVNKDLEHIRENIRNVAMITLVRKNVNLYTYICNLL